MTINKVTIQSSFGSIILLWNTDQRKPTVTEIIIPTPDCSAELIASKTSPTSVESSCLEIDALKNKIEACLNGVPIEFTLDSVDMNQCTPFQKKVLKANYATPRGKVCTYGGIARQIGVSGAARAVGNALAQNPFSIIIPCHRAIRSDGTLGGYQGGLNMKQTLLQYEGVVFDARGRVNSSALLHKDQGKD